MLDPNKFYLLPEWLNTEALKSPKTVVKSLKPGEGGTPLYGLYRYVRPQRVRFFSRFGHKLGIDFSHFAAGGFGH